MKEKTLIWGLDKDYYDNRGWIESNYNPTAYFDSNIYKLPSENGITKAELPYRINEFDKILISADPPAIIRELLDVYKVPVEKIDILFYELLKKERPEITLYGENNEDAVLLLLANKLNIPVNEIRYIEIGTNDPVRHNNTFALYEGGARGALVDAFPTVGILAKKVRPEDCFINCAVSDVSGENVVFYACESSAYSSLNEAHHKQYVEERPSEVDEILIPLVGINELIKRCDFKPNMLLCDAEGFDEKIVKGIDYDNTNFAIIMLETGCSDAEKAEMAHFLKNKGFKLFSSVKQNDIYYNIKYQYRRDK